MTKLLLFISFLTSLSYANSTDKPSEQQLIQKQKKEIVKQAGIILPGMTKEEVIETLKTVSEPVP